VCVCVRERLCLYVTDRLAEKDSVCEREIVCVRER